jgi:hypothetical protein
MQIVPLSDVGIFGQRSQDGIDRRKQIVQQLTVRNDSADRIDFPGRGLQLLKILEPRLDLPAPWRRMC